MQKTIIISDAQIDNLQQVFGLSLVEVGDVVQFAHGSDTLKQDTWEKLFAVYSTKMPYGFASVENGDPYEWVREELASRLSI